MAGSTVARRAVAAASHARASVSIRAMAFTIRQLQFFVAVAEQGSVSRAAQNLSISQSSVTEGDQGARKRSRRRTVRAPSARPQHHPQGPPVPAPRDKDPGRRVRRPPQLSPGESDVGRAAAARRHLAGRRLCAVRPARPLSPRLSGRRGHGDRGQWRLSRASAGRRRTRRRRHGHLQPARPHGAAGRDPRSLALPAVAAARPSPRRRRHHRHQRHRPRAADHADRRRDRGEHRQAAGRRSARARMSPSARARSRRCAASSPPAPASRCCPTSSTGRGRWKATASNRATFPARCRSCRSAWSGGAAPACRRRPATSSALRNRSGPGQGSRSSARAKVNVVMSLDKQTWSRSCFARIPSRRSGADLSEKPISRF